MLGDLNLYMGVMCSPYGDGVELAVFANEEFTWYTNQAVSYISMIIFLVSISLVGF